MNYGAALDEVVARLRTAGLRATRDAGAFYPAPRGVLVGMPSVIATGFGSRTLEVPVHVVAADPPGPLVLDALLADTEKAAAALSTATWEPRPWVGNVNADPLPSYLISCTLTITED